MPYLTVDRSATDRGARFLLLSKASTGQQCPHPNLSSLYILSLLSVKSSTCRPVQGIKNWPVKLLPTGWSSACRVPETDLYSPLMNVMWQHFDQSVKRLTVGHVTNSNWFTRGQHHTWAGVWYLWLPCLCMSARASNSRLKSIRFVMRIDSFCKKIGLSIH